MFGITPASSFDVNSDSSITATSPAEPIGTVDITVTTPNGTSATSPADEFTYTNGIPEFPSPTLPAIMIVGVIGTVLFIRRTREY